MREVSLTMKQAEYVREAHRRWNVAEGAVRSGKSHLAINYTIPDRLIKLRGKKGLNFILGVSLGNIERNVLSPMRDVFGGSLVGEIKGSENTATLFGEKVFCLGGIDKKAVSRLRGSEIKFCYCDELADLDPDVFNILKSRLSLEYSECHAACNPAGPNHWLKRFLDTPGIDLYRQRYTLYDNPFLAPSYVAALETEYPAGSVWHDRLIMGRWAVAEGLVYPNWRDALEDAPELFDDEGLPRWRELAFSIDYGTQNAFAALAWAKLADGWHAFREYRYSGRDEGRQKTDADYVADMERFCEGLPGAKMAPWVVDPSAASFIAAMRRAGFNVRKARNDVADGIRETAAAMQQGTVRVSSELVETAAEFGSYAWDVKAGGDRPVKVDDHMMDALRYGVATLRMYKAPTEGYVSVFKRKA